MYFKNNKERVLYFGKEFVSGNNLAVYEEMVSKDFADHTMPNGIIRFKEGQFIENWAFNNNADVVKALQTGEDVPNSLKEKLMAEYI